MLLEHSNKQCISLWSDAERGFVLKEMFTYQTENTYGVLAIIVIIVDFLARH